MDVGRSIAILALSLLAACERSDDISIRETSMKTPVVLAAAKEMYRDNPDTLTNMEFLKKAYYIEGKFQNCVWFVYDYRVGFNDSEFLYCTSKESVKFERI